LEEECVRIVVDAMGGDYAPGEIVSGAVQAARDFGGEIILVGREAEVKAALGDNARLPSIRIVHASDVIDMDEHPANAVKNKPDSSMVVGMKLVMAGEADAFATDDVLLYGLIAQRRLKGQVEVVGDFLSYDPIGVMYRRGDPAMARVVNDSFRRMAQDGEIERQYRRWFLRKLPLGVSIGLPMSAELETIIKATATRSSE